jgi:hypothetical protein
MIEDRTIPELFEDSPHRVDTELMKQAVSKWECICLAAFNRVIDLVKQHVENLSHKEFERFRYTGGQAVLVYLLISETILTHL